MTKNPRNNSRKFNLNQIGFIDKYARCIILGKADAKGGRYWFEFISKTGWSKHLLTVLTFNHFSFKMIPAKVQVLTVFVPCGPPNFALFTRVYTSLVKELNNFIGNICAKSSIVLTIIARTFICATLRTVIISRNISFNVN